MPETKIINGEIYYRYIKRPLERYTADVNAMHYRKKGFKARVVEVRHGFAVYTSPEGNPTKGMN